MSEIRPIQVDMKTACAMYCWRMRTVRQWVREGKFPRPQLNGRHWFWDVEVLEKWRKAEKLQVVTGSAI